MNDNEKALYNKTLNQIPVRKGKMKIEVMKRYGKGYSDNRLIFKFAAPVAMAMLVVLLALAILPKNDDFPLKVYAAEGEYVQLGKEAVSLKSKYEPYMLSYSTINSKQNEDYRCVFCFDIECESEDVERITYKIEGEKTYSSIAEFSKNEVWFAKISDKEYEQNSNGFPFVYRYMGSEGDMEIFTYLGSELVVEINQQDNPNYYIEYRLAKNEDGSLYANDFEIQVIIENKDGTTIEKKLKFEPGLEKVKDGINGIEIVNELWVNLE